MQYLETFYLYEVSFLLHVTIELHSLHTFFKINLDIIIIIIIIINLFFKTW